MDRDGEDAHCQPWTNNLARIPNRANRLNRPNIWLSSVSVTATAKCPTPLEDSRPSIHVDMATAMAATLGDF
jgi:hypothetical protein